MQFGALKSKSTLVVFLDFIHSNSIKLLRHKEGFWYVVFPIINYLVNFTVMVFRAIYGNGFLRATWRGELGMSISTDIWLPPCRFFLEFPKGVIWDPCCYYTRMIYQHVSVWVNPYYSLMIQKSIILLLIPKTMLLSRTI